MNRKNVYFVACIMLCSIIAGSIGAGHIQDFGSHSFVTSEVNNNQNDLIDIYSTYMPNDLKEINQNYNYDVDLPWKYEKTNILEWWVVIEYEGQIFEKLVPVSIADFGEKFLKHPEYGESLRFDIDSDNEDDIEVIAGFYWSVLKDADGNDVDSLEKRIRFRQLETGSYIEDSDASITVWSELHINYGLFKSKGKNKNVDNSDVIKSSWKFNTLLNKILNMENQIVEKHTFNQFFNKIISFIHENILDLHPKKQIQPIPIDENDYISVGMGYRSEEGEEIPRYIEKRFSFVRDELFSPSIFQHIIDPGSSKGQTSFESLYGFKSYKSGSTNPTYNIEISTEINPAVYMKTKFIPIKGKIFCYFDEASQRYDQTEITFTSNILKGVGENVALSILLDSIDDSLGRSGRWMSFDIDMVGDLEPLGGNIHYTASHSFTIGILLISPMFEEKIELCDIPQRVDIAWDLDFMLIPSPILYAHVDGYIDVSMSSQIGNLNVYYPKTDTTYEDKIFITIPKGIPKDTRFEAEATLNLDITDLQNNENYVSGKIKHDCSDNIDDIQVFLPDEEVPVLRVTDIPAYSDVNGKLYWNKLQGHVYVWRGSSGPPDPIEINLDYKGFHIHDIVTIRNGYIDTRFKVDTNGYFFFDTSEGIIGNELEVDNTDTGDSISLFIDEVSADNLQANWDIDTSGNKLKINDIGFNGMVDTMKGLILDLDYNGKTTSLNLDWIFGKTGSFQIAVDQEDDFTIDFSQFALNSSVFQIGGGITLSDVIEIDMDWQLKQGEETGSGNVDPGFFSINKNNDQAMIKEFDFYLTYQDQYGVNINFDNLQFYLDFEWWKGDRLLPYMWLDYEVSSDDFDVDLLWTNLNGETQWYENVEDW